jgi:hypothetical protein
MRRQAHTGFKAWSVNVTEEVQTRASLAMAMRYVT